MYSRETRSCSHIFSFLPFSQASVSNTIEAKGKTCKVAINGFGRIGRNFVRCWKTRGRMPARSCLRQPIRRRQAGLRTCSSTIPSWVRSKLTSRLSTTRTISVDGKIIQVVADRDPLQVAVEGNGHRHRHRRYWCLH